MQVRPEAIPRLEPSTLWETFATKAAAVGAALERVVSEAAAAALLRRNARAPQCTGSLAERFPQIATVCAPIEANTRGAQDVVAAGRFAVAETGSVAVHELTSDRAACFLAERLWLVVPADQIVATLDEALVRLASQVRDGARYVTIMAGPSRTADIERTLTIGVHGPRELTIVVVETGAMDETAETQRGIREKPPTSADEHRPLMCLPRQSDVRRPLGCLEQGVAGARPVGCS